MKILYVLPATTLCGGIKIAFEQAQKLNEAGHNVFIYCTNGDMSTDWFINYSFKFIDRITTVNTSFDKVIATFWATVYDIEDLKIKGDKYYLIQGKEPYFYFTKKEFDRVCETYKMGYKLITIAKSLKEWIEEDFKLKSFYVKNAINKEHFFKDVDNNLRTSGKKIILVEGDSMFCYKNVIFAFETLRHLRNDIEIWYMSMSPQNIDERYYDKLFNLRDVSQIRTVYSSCDLFIKPALLEGSPLPIMEAMACGSVIITNDIPSSREFCINNYNSVLCAKNSRIDYLKKINALLINADKCKFLSENALKTASTFNWSESIVKLEKCLKR